MSLVRVTQKQRFSNHAPESFEAGHHVRSGFDVTMGVGTRSAYAAMWAHEARCQAAKAWARASRLCCALWL
jgi:hypothetical protein